MSFEIKLFDMLKKRNKTRANGRRAKTLFYFNRRIKLFKCIQRSIRQTESIKSSHYVPLGFIFVQATTETTKCKYIECMLFRVKMTRGVDITKYFPGTGGQP